MHGAGSYTFFCHPPPCTGKGEVRYRGGGEGRGSELPPPSVLLALPEGTGRVREAARLVAELLAAVRHPTPPSHRRLTRKQRTVGCDLCHGNQSTCVQFPNVSVEQKPFPPTHAVNAPHGWHGNDGGSHGYIGGHPSAIRCGGTIQ